VAGKMSWASLTMMARLPTVPTMFERLSPERKDTFACPIKRMKSERLRHLPRVSRLLERLDSSRSSAEMVCGL